MPLFDFSQFFTGTSKREVEFLGLTEDQTRITLEQKYGISEALMKHCKDVTVYAGGPNSAMRCMIVWEANGRSCTYDQIAESCNIKADTAYQLMSKARRWAEAALLLRIEHSGEEIFLVSNDSIAAKSERVAHQLKKVETCLSSLSADVKSIKQAGQIPVLPGTVAAYVNAHEESKLLQAAS